LEKQSSGHDVSSTVESFPPKLALLDSLYVLVRFELVIAKWTPPKMTVVSIFSVVLAGAVKPALILPEKP
jgi:hypothetical protein